MTAIDIANPEHLIDMRANNIRRLGIIELFAGAAGLAQGFLQTGCYDLIALNDINPIAQETFQSNYPGIEYIYKDVHELKPKRLFDVADGRDIVGLLGGPPCQGFSLAGLKNPDDARNRYIKDYVRFVRAIEPDFLLMENVPQLLFHEAFQDLLRKLHRRYVVRYSILNAALYGVPQTRHRIFILAYRRELGVEPRFPASTHGFVGRRVFNYNGQRFEVPGNGTDAEVDILGADPIVAELPELQGATSDEDIVRKPFVNVRDAIGDLCPLDNGQSISEYPQAPETDYQRALRGETAQVFNHSSRQHQEKMLERIGFIQTGGDLEDIEDKSYWPKSHYSQAYGRLHWEGLARTITTHFSNPGSGRFTHPSDNRSITVREAARLQSFPDWFEFLGTQAQQMELVGNAVPPLLAKAIAKQIFQDIGELIEG